MFGRTLYGTTVYGHLRTIQPFVAVTVGNRSGSPFTVTEVASGHRILPGSSVFIVEEGKLQRNRESPRVS